MLWKIFAWTMIVALAAYIAFLLLAGAAQFTLWFMQ